MPRPHPGLLIATALAACATYNPAPVDLGEHARVFASRLPDLEAVRAFARAAFAVDAPSDAIDLATGKRIALWFHPELRQLRAEAGVARATADHAGVLPDPYLQGSVANKLGNENPWLVTSAFGLTLPLTGQLARAQDLADAQKGRALLHVLVREVQVQDELELAWVRWSVRASHVALLEQLRADLEGLAALAERLGEADEIARAEARAFRLEVVERTAQLLAASAERDEARAELDARMGLPPGNDLPLRPTDGVADRSPSTGAVEVDVVRGPALALLQRDHEVRERDLELQVSKQWPMLTLGPGVEEEDATNRPVINFLLPLPLWNRNQQVIAQAEAAREAAATALRIGCERALQTHHRAVRREHAARERVRVVDESLLPLCASQLADVRRQAELGHLDPLLILDAVTRTHDARFAWLEAQLAAAEATAQKNACFWPADAFAERPDGPVAEETPADGTPR